MPTAQILEKGEYDFEFRIFPDGGILGGFSVGLFRRFNMGISFGGTHMISHESQVVWNKEPGVQLKYRFRNECTFWPAFAVGFNSQGYGQYIDTDSRYLNKSRGLFIVASKNIRYLPHKDMGIHAGINYNTSEQDDDNGFNGFLGTDIYLHRDLAILAEYDFAFDDDNDNAYGSGDGYFNAGVKWTFRRHIIFQVHFKDIFDNSKLFDAPTREVKIIYVQDI
jgi:hypothetical protein